MIKFKKCVSLALSLALLASLRAGGSVPALAASGIALIYDLSVGGEHSASVAHAGDTVAVTFSMRRDDAAESYSLFSMQNEIEYDMNFFEYVSAEAVHRSGYNLPPDILHQTRTTGQNIVKTTIMTANDVYQAEETFCTVTLRVRTDAGLKAGDSGWVRSSQAKANERDVDACSVTAQDLTVFLGAPSEASYRITFWSNDGRGLTATQSAPQNTPTALSANTFTRSGYAFAGWNTAANGSGTAYTDGQSVTLTADLTLYAQWTPHAGHHYVTQKTLVANSRSHVLRGSSIEHTDTYRTVSTCSDCGHVETSTATETTSVPHGAWRNNSAQHWYVCSVSGCGATVALADHTFSGNTCTICGYTRSTGRPITYSGGGSSSGGGGGGSSSAPSARPASNDVPPADTGSPIVTSVVKPTETPNIGLASKGTQNPDGSVTVTVTDSAGNIVKTVKSGVRVAFAAREGEVAVLLDGSGREIELLEKSIVEGETAYVLVDGSCTIAVKNNAREFDDVQSSDWFNNSVVFASSHNLLAGVSARQFAPNTPMTRGMLVTALWRLENKPDGSAANKFPDVSDGSWYAEAVEWAEENSIVGGYDNGTFQPNRNVTRQEMAAILRRYLRSLSYDITAGGNLSAFADGGETASWALESMRWAYGANIIAGKSSSRIDPLGNATRAEVATMLRRIVNKMVR